MRTLRYFSMMVVALAALMVTSCKKDESSSSKVKVTEIKVEPSSLSMKVGDSQKITVKVLPDNAADTTFLCSSDNASVATIDPTTLTVNALKAGSATLTLEAKDGSGVKTTCKVDVRTPKAVADYTYLLYASGDSNLDKATADYLKEFFQNGPTENARYAIVYNPQYKSIQTVPELKHTYRLVIGKAVEIETEVEYSGQTKDDSLAANARYLYKVIKEAKDSGGFSTYEEKDLQMLWEPAIVKESIEWAAQKCPAQNYLIGVSGHGGGWDPLYERKKKNVKTRGVSWDFNFYDDYASADNAVPMTARELGEGIKSSSVAQKVSVYMDACNMNTIENATELAQSGAAYYISSVASVGSTCIPALMSILDTDPDPFSAYKKFRDSIIFNAITYYDESVWSLHSVESLNKDIKVLVDSLVASYEKDSAIYNGIIRNLAKVYEDNFDFSQFLKNLKDGTTVRPSVKAQAENVLTALKSAVAINYRTNLEPEIEKKFKGLDVYTLVYIVESYYYTMYDGKYGNVISESAFSKQTGWNKFLNILALTPDE